eukprot:TRINITY_DN91804_c0_g1_i1.p1 TRINITY_DN91804_c0_g1~~TRINITY_DN91804_c0_g1_i1.p1  ORF type:complete len:229 (-),score=42.52 TRINITY_DN91804_c0_g1_i1:71-757(-)
MSGYVDSEQDPVPTKEPAVTVPVGVHELTLPGDTHLSLVASTEAFRDLARALPIAARVLEIGCCRGHATTLLARRAEQVLALDISVACVEATKQRLKQACLGNVEVEQLDCMTHPEWLRMLGSRDPPFTHVFADIGGNRRLQDVLFLLKLLVRDMPKAQNVALKNEESAAWVESLDSSQDRSQCLAELLASAQAPERRPYRPMEVIMMYPVRNGPDSRELCRFANYGN